MGSESYQEECERKYQECKQDAIDTKKEYLKRFLPDWFVDSIQHYPSFSAFEMDKDEYIQLKRGNRKQRLEEAIGHNVLFRVWVDNYGCVATYVKLIEINDNEVTIESDGKEITTKAFNIHYAKRKEKKKIPKKRPKLIPPSELDFELIHDDWKFETYLAKSEYKGIPIEIRVKMRYGTLVKSWYITYGVGYGRNYFTDLEDGGKSRIEGRKEARKIAFEYIKNASLQHIENLSDFYKKSILEEGGK